ncbi:MAG: hypothetical protein ACFE9S_07610 [Candidatus Hermodarchaeota archaeon]
MPELIEGKMLGPGSSKAILMEINGEEMWIPKGHIEPLKGFKAIFAISDWLAWQKGLISERTYMDRKNNYKQKNCQEQEDDRVQKEPEQEILPF